MKKVILQTYAVLVFILLTAAAVYTIADISRLKYDRVSEMAPSAEYIATTLTQGTRPDAELFRHTVKIRLLSSTAENVIFRNPALIAPVPSVYSSVYRFQADQRLKASEVEVTYQLIETGELVSRLRFLLFIATAVMLITGTIIAFQPRRGGPRVQQNISVTVKPEPVKPAQPSVCFSKETGLMPEVHLIPRLQSELKRAASFDQDLVMAVFLLNPDKPDFKFSDFAGKIRDFFLFKDLCYEYGENSACVLLPNSELDDGIRTVKDFFKLSEKSLPGLTFSAGLSARSGRLLEPETLIREAEAALEKSRADGVNGITGFRADPAKYRALMQ